MSNVPTPLTPPTPPINWQMKPELAGDWDAQIDAECAFLGALFANGVADVEAGAIATRAWWVTEDHFTTHVNRVTFRMVADAERRGQNIPLTVIARHLVEDAKVMHEFDDDRRAVQIWLARTAGAAASRVNIGDYARVLNDALRMRRVTHELSKGALDFDADRNIARVLAETTIREKWASGPATIGDAIMDAIEPDETPAVLTGLVDLDEKAGGFRPGTLTIVAARPSMGKSTMAWRIARGAAEAGSGVLWHSIEDSQRDSLARAACDIAWSRTSPVHYSELLRGRVQDYDLNRVRKAAEIVADWPIVIDDASAITVADIRASYAAAARTLKQRPGVVIVDHIGLMHATGNYRGQRHLEVGEITQGLKAFAKDNSVAVVACCQLNRGVEGREDKRPNLADLRDSGRIEEDADAVWFLHRPEYYLMRAEPTDPEKRDKWMEDMDAARGVLAVHVAKARMGQAGTTAMLFCDVASASIRNADVGGRR